MTTDEQNMCNYTAVNMKMYKHTLMYTTDELKPVNARTENGRQNTTREYTISSSIIGSSSSSSDTYEVKLSHLLLVVERP